ncbi:MAG: transpeptidase family protein [Acidobacteriota bacterium]|nr:transpeptidase family protein [Acidobacteriota bacterium]
MNTFPRRRRNFFSLFLIVWGLVVVGRLAQLQLAQGAKYRAKAQRQQERQIEISPRRGAILDREGRELAVSVEVSSVYAAPDEVVQPAATARSLGAALGLPAGPILARLSSEKGFVWIARKIDPAAADRVRALKLAGVRLVPETKRFYPKGSLGAAVLGYVGTDDTGLAGLEYAYESSVRGKPGRIVAFKDARRSTYGEWESPGARAEQEGATLTLSLDSGIQYAAERELAATLMELHARSGSVVLMDPSNGEILAMASAPGFDLNQYGRYPAETRRNHAVADAYEPGSTFKVVTGSVALEDGVIGVDEVIDTGGGSVRIGNFTINEDKHHDYGPLTLAGVLAHSSNVGIIRVGLRLGAQRLYEGASRFGIGKPSGIDLPGEACGIFRPLSRWSSLSNASISMGQEVSLTALQLARVAAVIANGGLLVQPRLVTRLARPDGREERVAITPPVRVISEATAKKMRDMLVGVVENGTGAEAAIPGFSVAGKTGTAQKAGPGGYQRGRHVPNFVGFAPAENPKIVGVVVVEEPQGNKYYAAAVAAPLFSRIVSQALGIMRVAPEEQRVPSTVLASMPPQYPAGLVPAASRRSTPVPVSAPAADPRVVAGEIPDVAGLSARQALALFARMGLAVRLHGAGFVTSQTPSPGAPFRPGDVATLNLSESVPSVARAAGGREETSSSPFRP